MTIIFNLLCKALIAIIDILLLDFYLKNIYPNIHNKQKMNIKFLYYIPIFILIICIDNTINFVIINLIIILWIYIIHFFLHINKLDFFKKSNPR